MKILADYKEVDYVLWSNFVFSHPKGNIFQTPDIVKVYELTRNYSPIVIIATEKTDIAGVLVGVIQKEYKGLPGYLSSRCILTGGPLARNDDAVIIEALLLAYKSRVRSRVIYSQFRNIFSPEGYMNVFSKAGFSYDPHLDIHINLKQAHPEYWNSLKSKLRQNIRKAEKNNVQLYQVDSKSEITQAYSILQKVYRNTKLPLPDVSMFHGALEILGQKKNVVFFVARKDEMVIGCRFVLVYKGVIYDWYAGSELAFYQYKPNDFLPYKVIEWGMKDPESDLFVFGGAGKPGVPYGIRDYKLKFGKNIVEFGRFERVHNMFAYYLARIGFAVWRRFKR